ncbi:MAG: hypothetical protein JRD68_12755 [Deltaproteobacteria bacterium]|nr:hypothetical protein [Deltaproteobacteria bacterium]
MSINWGPHFLVPTDALKVYSGIVRLREDLDEGQLKQELSNLDISGSITRISNPWYYRKKDEDTWIKIGESDDKQEHFPVSWDTKKLANGEYQVLGLMHVFVRTDDAEQTIARQNIVDITITN